MHNIDVFDLEFDTTDPDAFIAAVKLLEPSFGGINLEDIKAPADVLIFPNLGAANIGYKMVERLCAAKTVGPLLMGISKPFNVLQRSSDMENVVHVIATTVAQAQTLKDGPCC